MKVAIIYNRDSEKVINLFGVPNREKYGLATINKIKSAIKAGGNQVDAFEGDKDIIQKLEDFMPSVISGERPGLIFNLSYGIQGRARYTHIPSILEMLGMPYVGSDPQTHAIALDKVVTKMLLQQKNLPTPRFAVIDLPGHSLQEPLKYPLIVKPKNEAVSFGIRVARNENELQEAVQHIYETFRSPVLVEEYIEGREFNVGLLGNNPVEALPPVELIFPSGEKVYTYEDKTQQSGRNVEKACPPDLPPEMIKRLQDLAVEAFKVLGCFDCARVDFRVDEEGNPFILEINSMPSLGITGSYVYAAERIGLDYNALVNRMLEVAAIRYFGTSIPSYGDIKEKDKKEIALFSFHTQNR